MTADEMRRAAHILDAEAESLHYCNTNESGEWVVYYEGQADREAHDEMRALAAKLRAMAEVAIETERNAERYLKLRSEASVDVDGVHVYGPDDDCIVFGAELDAAVDTLPPPEAK